MYIYKKLRPFQLPALEKIKQALDSNVKYIIIRAPTGLGKSFFPAQLSYDYRVLACVSTKSLQAQYVDLKVEHDGSDIFTELFGKGNYICGCSLKERGKPSIQNDDPFVSVVTADICEVKKRYRHLCRTTCDYYFARSKFIGSDAGIINYAKFLSDRPVVNSFENAYGFDPDILVFDEAHELSNLVVGHSGFSLNWSYKKMMRFCDPIQILPNERIPPAIDQQRMAGEATGWLTDLLESLKVSMPEHPTKGGSVKEWKWHKNRIDEVDTTIGCLQIEPYCWFIHTDENGITIRPKTAQYHFKPLFDKADKIVLMSATISTTDVESLGIRRDEYEFLSFPSPFPPSVRPIHNLNCPTITWRSTLDECKQHAQIISNAINNTSDYWTTLVHFPSKKKAEDWAGWFTRMTRRPVFVPQRGLPTDEAYREWLDFKDNNDGAICSAWQFWTGIDGTYLNTVIVADMPFPNFSEPFEKARFAFNPREGRGRVSNAVEQGQGRNRRGHIEHYGPTAPKYNAIAGGKKFDRLKSAFSKDFLDCIVTS